jgi:hypothetical protein
VDYWEWKDKYWRRDNRRPKFDRLTVSETYEQVGAEVVEAETKGFIRKARWFVGRTSVRHVWRMFGEENGEYYNSGSYIEDSAVSISQLEKEQDEVNQARAMIIMGTRIKKRRHNKINAPKPTSAYYPAFTTSTSTTTYGTSIWA